MNTCDCSAVLSNTGTSSCPSIMKVAQKLIIVPTYDSTGARNKIATGTLITPTIVTALINQTDKSKRWYPTDLIKNTGGERPEPIYDTDAAGGKSFVMEATRNFTAEIWNQGPEYKKQLDAARCTDFSVFIVDKNGSLIGMEPATPDGYLYPIRADKASWSVRWQMATDTTVQKLLISYDWLSTEDDAQVRMIAAGDMTADLLSSRGLLDISAEYSSISTTGVTITLTERFGSAANRNKLTGLLITDFFDAAGGTHSKLYNVTDAAAVSIATFEESAPGVYELTFLAQTSADVIRVTPVKSGFDFADVTAATFAIP